jgi:L-threonate 2-dehydrogenase
MQRALQGDYAPRAHMGLLAKDTALAVQAALQLSQDPTYQGPLGQRTSEVFAHAMAAGLAQEDDSALFKLLQTSVPR